MSRRRGRSTRHVDPISVKFRRNLREKGWDNGLIQPSSTKVRDPWAASVRQVQEKRSSSTSPSRHQRASTSPARSRLALVEAEQWSSAQSNKRLSPKRVPLADEEETVDLTSIKALEPSAGAVREVAQLLKTAPNRVGDDEQLRQMLRDAKLFLKTARSLRLNITDQALSTSKGSAKLIHATKRAIQACFGTLESTRREVARRTAVVAARERKISEWRTQSSEIVKATQQNIDRAQHALLCNTFVGHSTSWIRDLQPIVAAETRALKELGFVRSAKTAEFQIEYSGDGEDVDNGRFTVAFNHLSQAVSSARNASLEFLRIVDRTVDQLVAAEVERRKRWREGNDRIAEEQTRCARTIDELKKLVASPQNPALVEISEVADIAFAVAAAMTTRRLLDGAMLKAIDTRDAAAVRTGLESRRNCLEECKAGAQQLQDLYDKHAARLQKEYNARVRREAMLKDEAASLLADMQSYGDDIAAQCDAATKYGLPDDSLLQQARHKFAEAIRQFREMAATSANLRNAVTFGDYEVSLTERRFAVTSLRQHLAEVLLGAQRRSLVASEQRLREVFEDCEDRYSAIRSTLDGNQHNIASNISLVNLADEVEVALSNARRCFMSERLAERARLRAEEERLHPQAFDPATALLAQQKKQRRRERRRKKQIEFEEKQLALLEAGAAPGDVEAMVEYDSDGSASEEEDDFDGFDVGAEYQSHLDALSEAVESINMTSKLASAKTKRVQQELQRGWDDRADHDESLRDDLVNTVLRPANDDLFRLASIVEFYAPGHADPDGLLARFKNAQRAIRAALDAALQPLVVADQSDTGEAIELVDMDTRLDKDLARLKSMVEAAGKLANAFRDEVDELREQCIRRDQALDDQRLTLLSGPLKRASAILTRLDSACTEEAMNSHLEAEAEAVQARYELFVDAVSERDLVAQEATEGLREKAEAKIKAAAAKRKLEAEERERAAAQRLAEEKAAEEERAAQQLKRDRAIAQLASSEGISIQRAKARLERQEQEEERQKQLELERKAKEEKDTDFSLEALGASSDGPASPESPADGDGGTQLELVQENTLPDGNNTEQQNTTLTTMAMKDPLAGHDPPLDFQFEVRVNTVVQAEAVSELYLGQAQVWSIPFLRVMLTKAHEAVKLAHDRFEVSTAALSRETAEKEAAIREDLATSALKSARRVEELSRALDVFALQRLLDERKHYVTEDVHWARKWKPITERLQSMRKAIDVEAMKLVQEVPLTWQQRASQGVVPDFVLDMARDAEVRVGCLGSAELGQENTTVYAQVLSGCAWVAAEQDTLADCYCARSAYFDVASADMFDRLRTCRERFERAKSLIDNSPHKAMALQEHTIAYGFEALPDAIEALEVELKNFGPLESDASTRDFLNDSHAQCDRLDATTARFLQTCIDTEASLERAFQRRKAKELLERQELSRIAKGAALKVRDSRKLLRKVNKSGILNDPYTLAGRVPSRVYRSVESDHLDIVNRNNTTLQKIDSLLDSGGLGTEIDVSSEKHTQAQLERLTGEALASVTAARRADEDTRRFALKVLDTDDVLHIVKPSLSQLLGQTVESRGNLAAAPKVDNSVAPNSSRSSGSKQRADR